MTEQSSSKELPPDFYKPLDKATQEIRLIEILPSQDTDAIVELRLFCRRLEDASGQFIPYSYVWGDATKTKPIKVNGILMEVTCNLADLLRQTRTLLPDIISKGPWNKPALFWADAICINQRNLEERSHQVQLMGSIYSSAPLALAWLGYTKDASLATSLAESFDPPHDSGYRSSFSDLDYSPWMQAHPHLWKPFLGLWGVNKNWAAFEELLEAPYWTRTWTFQEMVLPAEVLCMCGSSLVHWRAIVAAQELLTALAGMYTGDIHSRLPATEAHEELYSFLVVQLQPHVLEFRELLSARTKYSSNQDRQKLTLVPRLAHHDATNPRDKVYGLLGVMETQLKADYTKDTALVYSEFISEWIRELKDLNFLLYASEHYRIARNDPTTLPTWAPDWEALSKTEDDIVIPVLSRYGLFMARVFESYDASAKLSPSNPQLCDGRHILTASGVVVDKVGEVFRRWRDSSFTVEFSVDILQFVTKYIGCFGSHPNPGLHVFQTLFRIVNLPHHFGISAIEEASDPNKSVALCFLTGILLELAKADDSKRPDWQSIAATYLPQFGIPPGRDFSRAWREDIFRGYIAEENMVDWEDAAAAMEWTSENCQKDVELLSKSAMFYFGFPHRFTTRKGYIGTAFTAQAGDLVVVLAGCKAPVLLRRRGSQYEHVGPCFVVGLMQGEAKQMMGQGEAKIETFEIR